ncbi:MAG: DEAD/DEAH box helicase [Candidatus Sumerlaeota bacterium]|nr:DEAD/DEAH box helicase [Candidatus Sumerlaeota bacterium]
MVLNVEQLSAHGLSARMIALWKKGGIDTLLPLQEDAIISAGVLQNKSLIVFAPTSSGKTFIAELAALKHLEANRKVVYLLPTKALAEEKYRRFKTFYGSLGYRVLVATRERPDTDIPALEGRFDLLIAVYEKMRSYLIQRPVLLSRVGLVVADEVQMLGEQERGGVVDLLLTKVAHSPYRAQFLGLSAVLGDALRLARWLGCDLLKEERRPVELREGVFDAEDGSFYYQEFNTGVEGVERLMSASGGTIPVSPEDDNAYVEVVIALAGHLAGEMGEQVLIFVPTRPVSRIWAEKLASSVNLPPAEEALSELAKSEETRERVLLAACFQKGIAFHNAELSWGVRRLIEEQYNAGNIRLLVSTSTLGEGVNLTGKNVIHVPEMVTQDEWTGQFNFVPLSHARFRNQGGRAGRFGRVSDFGRSILIAWGKEQTERLMREYIHGELEPLRPPLGEKDVPTAILDVVASGICRDAAGVASFLMMTYTGLVKWAGEKEAFDALLEREIGKLIERHFLLRREDGSLSVTGIGSATATSGTSIETTAHFVRWLGGLKGRPPEPFEALLISAFTPDAADFALPVSRRDRRGFNLPEAVREHLDPASASGGDVLADIFHRPGGFTDKDFSAFKKTLLLYEWIGTADTLSIEERFGVLAGTIAKLAEHFAWLIVTCAALADSLGLPVETSGALLRLAMRVQTGMGEEGISLARLRIEGLERCHLQALVRDGYDSPDALRDADPERLRAILPGAVVDALLAEVSASGHRRAEAGGEVHEAPAKVVDAPRREEPSQTDVSGGLPILTIRLSEPGIVMCEGKRLRLTPLPWRLLLTLARHPGEVVSYITIDEEVWPGQKVERQQVSFHRAAIVRALAKVLGKKRARAMFKTYSGQGMLLDLQPYQLTIDN